MNIEELLARLQKVRGKSPQWTACCPAHEDKNPSLAIHVTDTHQILLHCKAACSFPDICSALGVTQDEMFPPDHWLNNRPGNQEWLEPRNALRILSDEIYIQAIASADNAAGRVMTEAEIARRRLSAARIKDTLRYVRSIR